MITINSIGTGTLATDAQVTPSLAPDALAPLITKLEWTPFDIASLDADSGKYGSGLLTVRIEVSEPVSGLPYFAVVPPGLGLPIQINLFAINDQQFEGSLAIEEGMPSGRLQSLRRYS